jgi:hypothetical protein
MSNAPMPAPDKDAIYESLSRLKTVFQEAANNRKVAGASSFKALSTTFNNAVDEAFAEGVVQHDRQSYLEAMISVMHVIQPAISDLQKEARRDANTFAILKLTDSRFRDELQNFIKAVNGTPDKKPPPPNRFVPPKGDYSL